MNGFILCRFDGTAKLYYSPIAGRAMGAAGNGWVAEDQISKALGFARQEDAQAFLDVHLPHQAPYCHIIMHQWGDN